MPLNDRSKVYYGDYGILLTCYEPHAFYREQVIVAFRYVQDTWLYNVYYIDGIRTLVNIPADQARERK